MSTLTDFFTSLANKVRSNLGTETTYTPAEAVEAIDDVYDAGEAAGVAATKVGTAAKGDVLSGKTFTNSSTIGETGTMTNNGAVSKTLDTSTTSYTVPAGYHNGSGTVSITTETKTDSPNVSTTKDVTPSSGKVLSKVTINPLSHTGYSPSSSTYTTLAMGESKSIDLGANHDKRYVRVQAAAPSGNKSITSNGTNIDVSAYATASVSVTPSLQSKSDSPNVSTNKTVSPDSGYDGLSSVTITPLSHTGYSPSSSTYTSLAMGESKSIDLGANHSTRYVRVQASAPSGAKSITANGTGIDVSAYATANVSVPNPTLSGDADEANVLSGKKFYKNNYTIKTGSMTNNGAVSPSGLNCGGSYTIPAGYHNGSGVVSANSLSSQTGVESGKTAVTAAKMFSGYQGWVNGSRVTGTYTEPTINNITPSNTSPVAMSVNNNYKMVTNGGYAIQSYASSSKTPTDSGTQFSEGWNRMTSGGYAYPQKPEQTETLLWENANQTTAFAEQTITLSQSMANFHYIKFVYQLNKDSAPTPARTMEYIVLYTDFIKSVQNGSTYHPLVGLTVENSDNTSHCRQVFYVSDTQIKFVKSMKLNAGYTSNDISIPLYIYGIKALLPAPIPASGFTETTLWTNSAPTSNFDTTTVTLSDSIRNYDYIKITVRKTTTDATTRSYLMTVDEWLLTSGGRSDSIVLSFHTLGTSVRPAWYVSDTQVYIYQCQRYTSTGTSTSNSYLIPLTIKGLNFTNS